MAALLMHIAALDCRRERSADVIISENLVWERKLVPAMAALLSYFAAPDCRQTRTCEFVKQNFWTCG